MATTIDTFHRGNFQIIQPAGRGHRSGMDAMVLAASVPDGFTGTVADLGAGAGAAGFAVVSRCSTASAVLVELDPQMADCARRSAVLEGNAHLRDRLSVLLADVELSGRDRVRAGLTDRSFDHVIMNPPFNNGTDRQTPDPLKRTAHVMAEGMFEAWLRTAAAILRPGGQLSLIARPSSLAAILTACEGRFGGLQIKPVHPEPGKDAIRIVVRGDHGSRAGLVLSPPLTLHEPGKTGFSDLADAICNGRAALFGD